MPKGTEMFVEDPEPGESPDLGAWADFFTADEVEELKRLSAQRRAEPEPEE